MPFRVEDIGWFANVASESERKLKSVPADQKSTWFKPYDKWLAANGVEPRPACDRWNQGEDGNDE